MARPTLPRHRVGIAVVVDVAAANEDEAYTRANLLIDDTLRDRLEATIRNYGGRTMRLAEVYPDGSVAP